MQVAVKTIKEQAESNEQEQFEFESRLLSALSHVGVVSVVGVIFSQHPHMLVLELMQNGDLEHYLQSNAAQLTKRPDLLSSVCMQVANAMLYLSERKIIHRDLAAR